MFVMNQEIKCDLGGFGNFICNHTWSFLHGFLDNTNSHMSCMLRSSVCIIYDLELCWDSNYKQVL